jgi:serine/threonine protein kinase
MAENHSSPAPGHRANSARLNTITPPGEKLKDVGEIALERGYCTADRLKQAQDEHRKTGSNEELSAFLVKQGVLTQQQARACERATRGATVIGGFEILEKVGQGGMGAVFRARQISMERIVALKILPPKLAQDPVFKQRFLYEARLSAKLSHINIISGINCGEEGGYTYFAMEFVDGKTVKQILKANGKFPLEDAVAIVRQMAEALVYAQSHNLVHRDIKPDNIMMTSAGVAKLCDLGLAKQTEKSEDASLTQAGQAVGTPHYISPEQARGEKTVDTRADIYSLGGTFYHMIVGKTPFDAPTGASVMAMHITDSAKNPCDIDAEIPIEYGQIIAKMMCKAASGRYANASELLEDLDAAQNGEPVSAAEFDQKSSCALPKKAGRAVAAPQPQGVVMQLPTGERRSLTGRYTATGGSLTSFMSSGLLIFLLGAAGYYYYTQNGGGKPANTAPAKAPEKTEEKIDPVKPAPITQKETTPPAVVKAPVSKPPDKTAESSSSDPKTESVKKPVDPAEPDKVVATEPAKTLISSRAVPKPPKEIAAPKIELTGDMLYARFLAEMPRHTSKGDLQRVQNEVRDLSNRGEFGLARTDINAELTDYAAATTYELDAVKSRAAAGGMVDLSEEKAKKWETRQGRIIGSDPVKGLFVEIIVKGSKLQLYVAPSDMPLPDIIKVAPDKSALGQMRYLSARGNYKEATTHLAEAKLDEKEHARWERKLRLAVQGEKELQAQAVFNNLGKVAEVKSWKTFMAMSADYEKGFSDTSAAAENMVAYQEWKSMARAALAPIEGLESTGKFSPVKWPGLNPSSVEVKTDADNYNNKTILIEADAAVEPEKTEKGADKPKTDKDRKMTDKEKMADKEKGEKGEKGDKEKKGIPAENDKAAVMRLASEALDLTDKNVIVFRTRHKHETPLKVAIGFLCGEQYMETKQVSTAGGGDWYEHRIRIDGATFKGPADDYTSYEYELPTREKIRGLVILVYTKAAFSIEVDAVQLNKEK